VRPDRAESRTVAAPRAGQSRSRGSASAYRRAAPAPDAAVRADAPSRISPALAPQGGGDAGRSLRARDSLRGGGVGPCVEWSFDTLDHGWLIRFVAHRVADRRVVRLLQQGLSAGVLEEGQRIRAEVGTVQGGSISPLVANLYLHYVFDLWTHRWRTRHAQGDVVVVRFADDFVVGFEHREEAEGFLTELRDRFARFGLALHPDKTRLIEFGRCADRHRRGRGDGKPETFNFLGFTHACSRTRKGRFTVLRQTMRRRWQAKLQEVKTELRRRLHAPIPDQGAYLRSVLLGHARYYGVPRNGPRLAAFHFALVGIWRAALQRRSQTASVTWPRMARLRARWLPIPHLCHPYPSQRLAVVTQGKSRMR
jgi:RNA-directed DNA polymerase